MGYVLRATDGDIGRLKDLLFDDHQWVVRYMVVDTGRWLPGRRVLIAPVAAGRPEWENRLLPVQLSCEQIENSPTMHEHLPVSRQQEVQLSAYYGWAPYWGPIGTTVGGTAPVPVVGEAREKEDKKPQDPHLRSVCEVAGYHIHCSDNSVGRLDDFITDTGDWSIRYLIVDTRSWPRVRKVVVAPQWIKHVDWERREVLVNLTCQQLRDSPEFDPSEPVNREYETRLYDYYGRPRYWEDRQ